MQSAPRETELMEMWGAETWECCIHRWWRLMDEILSWRFREEGGTLALKWQQCVKRTPPLGVSYVGEKAATFWDGGRQNSGQKNKNENQTAKMQNGPKKFKTLTILLTKPWEKKLLYIAGGNVKYKIWQYYIYTYLWSQKTILKIDWQKHKMINMQRLISL